MPDFVEQSSDYGRRVGARVAGVMREYGITGRQLAANLAGPDGHLRHESYVSLRLNGKYFFAIDELYVVAAVCSRARPDLPRVSLLRLLDVVPSSGTVVATGGYAPEGLAAAA